MDDKELLELAAKAAGLDVTWKEWRTGQAGRFGCITYTRREGFWLGSDQWNPLTDDGDALRLAVKLQLIMNVTESFSHVTDGTDYFQEFHNDDPYAATRRAIVRAAAEIGRSK